MSNQIEAGTTIGNIAILDLRTATKESVGMIRTIGNVAIILTSPETAALAATLRVGNAAQTIEVSGDPMLISGNETLTRDSFKHISTPLDILVAGNVIFASDIQPEELEAGLGRIVIAGNVVCPDHLAGIINAKAGHVGGNLAVIPAEAQFIQGSLNLTESYLRSLADDTAIAVMGTVKATDLLPNELLTQKLSRLNVFGRVICHEENASAIMTALDSTATNVTLIPTGYSYVERELTLTNAMLAALPGKKLYCQSIRIGDDVEADALRTHVESLIVKNMLICPESLQSTVASICNLLETQAIFYKSELWLFDDSTTLLAQRFDYLEEKATMLVTGELTVAEDADPAVLASRLDKVHNLGIIRCSTAQMAALQSRLGVNHGLFEELKQREASEENDNKTIGNIAYLKL